MQAGRENLGVSWWVRTPYHSPPSRCCRAACMGHKESKPLPRALVVARPRQVESAADKTHSTRSLRLSEDV